MQSDLPSTPIVAAEPTDSLAVASAPAADILASETPQWLHPLSLLFEFISGVRQQLIPAALAVYSAAQWGMYGIFFASIFFAITMGVAIFRYLTVRYQIRGNDLIVDQGLFFKRHRTIPIHRIQNVDLMQTVLHRLFRVAEVRIETAGGSEPEAKLRVLSLQQIESLRSRIFERAIATKAESNSDALVQATFEKAVVDEPTVRLLRIPTALLIKAGLLSNRGMIIVGAAIGAAMQFAPWENSFFFNPVRMLRFLPWQALEKQWILAIVAIVFVLILMRVFSAVWYVLRFHGYVLERRGDEFRIQCGLFSRLSATVPRRRIQLISIHRTLLGKSLGIASIRIETAGGAGTSTEDSASSMSRRWFIPVIDEKDVSRIVREIRPELDWNEKALPWSAPSPRAARRMRRLALLIGLAVSGIAIWNLAWWGVVVGAAVCAFAYWFAGKKAAAMRYVRSEFGIAYRSGLLTKKCSITFLEKVQSVWLDHSPFDRRWKMATLCIDTAGSGPAEHKIQVGLLEENFAQKERAEIALRASAKSMALG